MRIAHPSHSADFFGSDDRIVVVERLVVITVKTQGKAYGFLAAGIARKIGKKIGIVMEFGRNTNDKSPAVPGFVLTGCHLQVQYDIGVTGRRLLQQIALVTKVSRIARTPAQNAAFCAGQRQMQLVFDNVFFFRKNQSLQIALNGNFRTEKRQNRDFKVFKQSVTASAQACRQNNSGGVATGCRTGNLAFPADNVGMGRSPGNIYVSGKTQRKLQVLGYFGGIFKPELLMGFGQYFQIHGRIQTGNLPGKFPDFFLTKGAIVYSKIAEHGLF